MVLLHVFVINAFPVRIVSLEPRHLLLGSYSFALGSHLALNRPTSLLLGSLGALLKLRPFNVGATDG